MAKKKPEVAYVPLNKAGTNVPIFESKVAQIPAYEDSGVKYQGKYKVQKSSNEYELKAQYTRFVGIGISNGAFGSTIFPRERPETKFYCTKMVIQHHDISTFSLSVGYIIIGDVKGSTRQTRFLFYPVQADDTIVLDFSDSPRLFEGDSFDLFTPFSFGATEFLFVSMFGWEEQP